MQFGTVVLAFLIGAFLGDLVETVFCRITAGVWMSRSSLVWGPFSVVWGLAIALATALLYKDRDKQDHSIFGRVCFWAVRMNIFAAFLQNCVLEKFFGIIVISRLIWAEGLICCIASFGGLQQSYGLRHCTRIWHVLLKHY